MTRIRKNCRHDRSPVTFDRLRRSARARRRRPLRRRGGHHRDGADRPRRRRRRRGGEPHGRRARHRERARRRDVVRPQVLRGPPHLRLLGRPREDPARLRPRPAGARRSRQGRSSPSSTSTASTSPSRTPSPRPAPPTRSAARTSPRPPAPAPTSVRSSRSTWCPGAKAFVSRSWPSAEQAVDLIHEAGGVAVVAHPYWDVKDPVQVRDLVESLVNDVGLDGIETFYPPHTEEQTKHCLELCEEFGLVPTASSDFHGPTHKTFSKWGDYDTYGLGEPRSPTSRSSAVPLWRSELLRGPRPSGGPRGRGVLVGRGWPPAGSKNSIATLGRLGTWRCRPSPWSPRRRPAPPGRAERGGRRRSAPAARCRGRSSPRGRRRCRRRRGGARRRRRGLRRRRRRVRSAPGPSGRGSAQAARSSRGSPSPAPGSDDGGGPAIPIAIGSQRLSWLPTSSSGPVAGIVSRPVTVSRPHQRTTGVEDADDDLVDQGYPLGCPRLHPSGS